MSTTIGFQPVANMLPITGTWTLPFASYFLYLTNRVVSRHYPHEKYVGDRLFTTENAEDPDPLYVYTRMQANFLENVPLAFIFAAVAELNGADRKLLNYAMAALLALRISHAELGLRGKGAIGLGRPVGYYGTQAILAGLAGWGTWLIKGYWGY